MDQHEMARERILRLHSRFVQEQAEKLLLPNLKFDSKSEMWERSDDNGKWRLTRQAIADLRTAIRNEKRERLEAIRTWLGIVTGFATVLTGLIGAIIGLISVL